MDDFRINNEFGADFTGLTPPDAEEIKRTMICDAMANAFFATSKENQLACMDEYYRNK